MNNPRERLLTPDLAREMFYVDGPDLKWMNRPRPHFTTDRGHKMFNARYAGNPVGTPKADGRTHYRQVRVKINGEILISSAHRVSFLIDRGYWPKGEIGHDDGDGLNNSPGNLHDVSHAENMRNRRMYRVNKSGITGVYWRDRDRKWVAQIRVDKKCHHLGQFATKEQAANARREAEAKYGFHKNHGSNKQKDT